MTGQRLRQTVVIFFLSVGIQLFSYLWGLVGYRWCAPEHKTVMQYATVCSNSGILGTPIAEGIFGAEGTLLAAVFLIPLRVVMWTLGLSFFTRKSGKFSLKKIVTHPCIAAVLVGIVLLAAKIPVPSLLKDTLTTVGSCNTAISMLLVGSIVADMSPELLVHRDTLYFLCGAASDTAALGLDGLCGIGHRSVGAESFCDPHHHAGGSHYIDSGAEVPGRRSVCIGLHCGDHGFISGGCAAVVRNIVMR